MGNQDFSFTDTKSTARLSLIIPVFQVKNTWVLTFIPLLPSCSTKSSERAPGKRNEETCPKPHQEQTAEPRAISRGPAAAFWRAVRVQPRTQAHPAWHSQGADMPPGAGHAPRPCGSCPRGYEATGSPSPKPRTGSSLPVNHEELWKPL